MTNMRKLLEAVDSMAKAAKKPTGPKFPGYWKGTDPASKAKSKMVGGCEESILKDLHDTAKQKSTEWALEEAYRKFNEVELGPVDPEVAKMSKDEVNRQIGGLAKSTPADNVTVQKPEYKGIDPIVRNRLGMQPATQGEIQSYLDKNPTSLQTSTGQAVTSGSGTPIKAAGPTDVGIAADTISPDRAQSVAREPVKPVNTPTPQQPATVKPVGVKPSSITSTPIPPVAPTAAPVATKPVKTAPAIPKMPENPREGSWQEIWKNNPQIKNPHLIYPGQQIKLPGEEGGTLTVQKGDTLSGIAARLRGENPNPQATTRGLGGTQAQLSMPDYIVGQIPGVESGNNPNAVSPKGAVGAWQTMPSTLKDPGFGITPAKDTSAEESNRVGRDYAHAMYNRYGGDTEKALAAYNAGPGRVDKAIQTAATKGGDWKDYIPYETQAYLPKFNLTPPNQYAMKENKELARKHDVGHFARLLRDLESKEQVDEYENAQDPNAQVTSQPDPTGSVATGMDQQAAADKEQAVDVATAKGTMSSLKNVLGPKVDTNALSSAVTKISDGKPLTAPEATSMSALSPLISKAAETPQTAMALKTALSNAAMLAKQGK